MKYLIVFLFLLLNQESIQKQIRIQCPSYCRCDFFKTFKRAECANRNIFTVSNIGVPKRTEVLDLSQNLISHLDGYTFSDNSLFSLKILNVSHNKVSQIHLNAFADLKDLRIIDLSHNAIRYVLSHWFFPLESLEELYLQGNPFGELSDATQFFESKTLKVLDLSQCSIPSLPNDIFLKLPNLQKLDLSGNFLTQLNIQVITPLQNLLELDLNQNNLKCSDYLSRTELVNYTQMKNITFKNPCIQEKPKLFERIVQTSNPTLQDNWLYDEAEDNSGEQTPQVQCTEIKPPKQNFIINMLYQAPILTLSFAFVFGLTLGSACCFCISVAASGGPTRRMRYSNIRTTSMRRRSCSDLTRDDLINVYNPCEVRPNIVVRSLRKVGTMEALNMKNRDYSLLLREQDLGKSSPVLGKKNSIA